MILNRPQVYRVSIASKLIILAVLKFAQLDPLGMGVEMEGGKPGWNGEADDGVVVQHKSNGHGADTKLCQYSLSRRHRSLVIAG